MNPSAQAKVLRVLQEGELERVGGAETIKVDVRVSPRPTRISPAEIAAGRFREDLFYRLTVVPIELPPLRARREDIPALVEHFLDAGLCARQRPALKKHRAGGDDAADAARLAGQRARAEERRRAPRDPHRRRRGDQRGRRRATRCRGCKPVKAEFARGTPFKDLVAAAEREIILAALEANDHHVSNTARELQLERSHLYKKMRALGIDHRAGTEDLE